ncbi:MAG TPA: tetratricopeptide repeat protein, partial [Saprospiraceae bacterium]|nr:tetratricopeptide repeat protein [Saprospiraceae bacterium]
PFGLPLVQAKSHVLLHAMHGLSAAEQKALHTIAAFRMAAQYDTLRALLCGDNKPCADEEALDTLLNELEDRGLIGWDRRANRYDLHPVVRGVVWSGVSETGKKEAYTALQGYFDAAPKVKNDDINKLEDLTSAIELYSALIGLGRFDDAHAIFADWLVSPLLYRLGANRQMSELLEYFFLHDLEVSPKLSTDRSKSFIFCSMALAYHNCGEPGKSSLYYEKASEIDKNDQKNLAIDLFNLADALRLAGCLQKSTAAVRRALEISQEEKNRFQEAVSLQALGLALAAAGQKEDSKKSLEQSRQILIEENNFQGEGYHTIGLAQHALWLITPADAKTFADRAWELAHIQRYEADFIRAACRQGQAMLDLGNLDTADERLHHALTRARAINYVEEELPALTALAELRRRQGQPEEARQLLDDVWEAAERGPYPLFHADACNVLCQLERDAGNTEKAIAAATHAYRLAWCDGPPWAYHYGLENAKRHLKELGVKEPEMPKSPLEEGAGG